MYNPLFYVDFLKTLILAILDSEMYSDIVSNNNSNMDSSFGQPLYHPRSQKAFDGVSIATTNLGVALKAVDMPCGFHP